MVKDDCARSCRRSGDPEFMMIARNKHSNRFKEKCPVHLLTEEVFIIDAVAEGTLVTREFI